MRIERDIIEGKFDIIERNLRFLKEIKALSPEQFLNSYRDLQAAKYSLLEIMEACIDIANYIISVKGFRRAEEYSEMFKVLKEEGILGKKLANKLEDMARFRNLLVHRYGEVDNRRVLDACIITILHLQQLPQALRNSHLPTTKNPSHKLLHNNHHKQKTTKNT